MNQTLKSKTKGKGNIKAQNKRKRERLKHRIYMEPWDEAVELIDGNFSHYPCGYCIRYHSYLTQGLMDTHGCLKYHCRRLRRAKK